MPKKKTIAQEVDSAAVLLQKLVRLKASDDQGYCTCVTCGCVRRWNDGMQGGHFISRKYTATKLMEENVHSQCSGCNGPRSKDGTVTIAYTTFMLDTYGREFVDELQYIKGLPKKYTREEVADIKNGFRDQIKALEGNLA
jgi:hypothetical protein